MKKLFYITGIALILMSAVSCNKEDGPVVDEGLKITAVKTRCDGTYEYLLKSASSEKIPTSEGSFYFYNWESCEALKEGFNRLACANPTVYGESYTKLVIKANKAISAKVVSTDDSPVCAEIVPANDGQSFEVKYKSGSEGNGAAYILVQSTDGTSTKLISVGVFKTIPQIIAEYPTLMYYEVWDSTGKKKLSEQTVTAIDNDATSLFSVDSGSIMKFKGIWHNYLHNYDVHNYCNISYSDTLNSSKRKPVVTHLSDFNLIDMSAAVVNCNIPGFINIEVLCKKVDKSNGTIKSQYFTFEVKKKK